jgi:hypothetical protein
MRTAFASAIALVIAAPAAASTQVTVVGPNSGSATLNCAGEVGPKSGPGVVRQEAACSSPAVGTAIAGAVAAPGHLGADARADSHNGDSLSAENGAQAQFIDFVTFTSSNPLDTTATVAADFFLDGSLEAAVNGAGFIRVFTAFGGADFDLRQGLDQNGLFGFSNSGFVFEGGQFGQTIDSHLRTPFVVVPLNSPVQFRMILEVQAGASGPGAHGLADLGQHSFKFATTPFLLENGVTANAGDYLVNNRFIDPLATADAVPEPAAWALMILGFGTAGAMLRRRRAVIA